MCKKEEEKRPADKRILLKEKKNISCCNSCIAGGERGRQRGALFCWCGGESVVDWKNGMDGYWLCEYAGERDDEEKMREKGPQPCTMAVW